MAETVDINADNFIERIATIVRVPIDAATIARIQGELPLGVRTAVFTALENQLHDCAAVLDIIPATATETVAGPMLLLRQIVVDPAKLGVMHLHSALTYCLAAASSWTGHPTFAVAEVVIALLGAFAVLPRDQAHACVIEAANTVSREHDRPATRPEIAEAINSATCLAFSVSCAYRTSIGTCTITARQVGQIITELKRKRIDLPVRHSHSGH